MKNKPAFDRQVISLVAQWSHRSPDSISLDTLINAGDGDGLGVDGADADELVEFVSRGVGWPLKEFNWDDYFGPEVGWEPIGFLLSLVRRRRLAPLTIAMLSQKFFDSKPVDDAE